MSTRLLVSIVILKIQCLSIAVCCATDITAEKTGLCGPLSANFVIQYYRGSSNLVEVIEHCGSTDSEESVSLLQIKDCLQSYGISSSAVRLPADSRYFAKTPVILHTKKNGGHFAVLLPRSNGAMTYVYEPAVGVITRSWEGVHEEMPDYALVTTDSDSPTENGLIIVESRFATWVLQSALRTFGLCLVAVGVTLSLSSSRRGQRIPFRST